MESKENERKKKRDGLKSEETERVGGNGMGEPSPALTEAKRRGTNALLLFSASVTGGSNTQH